MGSVVSEDLLHGLTHQNWLQTTSTLVGLQYLFTSTYTLISVSKFLVLLLNYLEVVKLEHVVFLLSSNHPSQGLTWTKMFTVSLFSNLQVGSGNIQYKRLGCLC